MSINDLSTRPIFYHTSDPIEAHLTIMFTAPRDRLRPPKPLRNEPEKILTTLRLMHHVTTAIDNTEITIPPETPTNTQELNDNLTRQ